MSKQNNNYNRRTRIAYFISPHGFGHAARAAGVMEAIAALDGFIHFEIFTKVPQWFFEDSTSLSCDYHSLQTDIGLVQKTPFKEDLPATIRHLDSFFPFDLPQIERISRQIKNLGCALVICDIAPMGIVVSQQAGIPSLLVENFTWDWIYQGYASNHRRMRSHIDYLQQIFESSDYHIQTEPVCRRKAVDLTTAPVSRKIRTPRNRIREQLGASPQSKIVLMTTGGIPQKYGFIEKLKDQPHIHFVIPGGSQRMEQRDNVVFLPHHSQFYHPDLVNAADAVIGKAGYSTLAEVYHAGVPFGYIARSNFRESESLVEFIDREVSGFAIDESDFQKGGWIAEVPKLLDLPRIQRKTPNGAEQIARFVLQFLEDGTFTAGNQ